MVIQQAFDPHRFQQPKSHHANAGPTLDFAACFACSLPLQVTCGSYHTACLTDDGKLFTCGGGLFGKLGHGDETGYPAPKLVESLKHHHIVQVACGSRHTLALSSSHAVFAWGDLESGVCGLGRATDSSTNEPIPTRIKALDDHDIVRVSACGFHSAFLSA